ncbi:MAG: hypothetical protein ABEK16_03275 [Candidatus Nanohalobium sp.]
MESDVEERILESLRDGYSPEEIVEAMRQDGFSDEEIKREVSNAQRKIEEVNKPETEDGEGPVSKITGLFSTDAEDLSPEDYSFPAVMLLSFVFPPMAYHFLKRDRLAVVNLVTLNYFLLGFIAAPIHCYTIMK